jgi:ATP-dependent helicase HrpB
LIPLPIDDHLGSILAALRRSRAVVVVAAPGAGKTTRVPPALTESGAVLLLQPRRAAARAAAARIADEHQWAIGKEVGWHIRFERRFSPATRLLVATEGILTARLRADPLISEFNTVVLDEFHERSIHTDVGLALLRQAWRARSDLSVVVMSATLDPAPVSRFLSGCPVIEVGGTAHPVAIDYAPGRLLEEAARDLYLRTDRNVLCFVPGAADAERACSALRRQTPPGTEVLPLYGALSGADQDRALSPSKARRIIVATNVAETSVTVPGVTAVVDSGLQKVARYDHARGLDSLQTERVTQDAADQRAGRAGRIAAGRVIRLWDAADRLRPAREAEVQRVDLSGCLLDIMACGERPERFEWFEPPRPDVVSAGLLLLQRLGAIVDGRLTPMGQQMSQLPLTPRLARMLLAARGARDVARACALLSEGVPLRTGTSATSSDLLSALDAWEAVGRRLDPLVKQIERLAGGSPPPPLDEPAFRRAVLAGYPDRVAQRRGLHSSRFKLSSGAGAALSRDSGVHNATYVVALEVAASTRPDDPDALIRVASAIEPEWLAPTHTSTRAIIDAQGVVRGTVVSYYDELAIAERPCAVAPAMAEQLLAEEWRRRPRSDDDRRLLCRLAFAGLNEDEAALLSRAVAGKRAIDDIALADGLSYEMQRTLAREAPETLTVPSGRSVPIEYGDDGSVAVAVKLQEMFGLEETPRLGSRRTPVLVQLLAPNGRPVQVTRDLASFWARTYPEVRKELRGRYPKHPWPEDPLTAPPTARTTRRP